MTYMAVAWHPWWLHDIHGGCTTYMAVAWLSMVVARHTVVAQHIRVGRYTSSYMTYNGCMTYIQRLHDIQRLYDIQQLQNIHGCTTYNCCITYMVAARRTWPLHDIHCSCMTYLAVVTILFVSLCIHAPANYSVVHLVLVFFIKTLKHHNFGDFPF